MGRIAAALLALLACGCPGGQATPPLDLLVRGGTVVDGTGAPPRRADVGLREGRIVSIGDPGELDGLDDASATRTIDATGLVVAPGFIDLHSHADLILLADDAVRHPLLRAKMAQGVTTIVTGNCGLGVAPATTAAATVLEGINGWMSPGETRSGALSVADYLGRLESRGVPLNVATLVPHGPVRISAMGLTSGAASPAQLETMRRAVDEGLEQGAYGLSCGLIYPPGMYSPTDELVALAQSVAARDGLFTAHVRGSSETLLAATDELIEIARRSGARVHHSHLEAVGERFWPLVTEVLEREDAARRDGLRLSHDVFLYTRAATMMAAIFPPWALEGGVDRLLARLADPAARARLRDELERRVPEWPPWTAGGWPHNLVGAVGWDGILVASVPPDGAGRHLVGRSLAEIGRTEGRDPFDVVADLMVSESGRVGQLVDEISGRDDRLDTLIEIFVHPAAAVISDAEDYGRGTPHPAHAGAFVRALRINRERSLMPLESVIRRMTSYPASILGLADRGEIRLGAWGDLVLFDPARVTDRATWDSPRATAQGVHAVVINGETVISEGSWVGDASGRVLRSTSVKPRSIE